MMRLIAVTATILITLVGCSDQPSSTDVADDKAMPSAGQAAPADSSGSPIENEDALEKDLGVPAGDPAADAKPDEAATVVDPPPAAVDSPAAMADAKIRAEVFANLEQMASEAAVERRAASDTLDTLGLSAMPFIIEGLREGSDAQKRGAATYLIGRVSPRDDAAVKALVVALSDRNKQLRCDALQAVEKIAPEQLPAALPALLAFAENRDDPPAYRSRAVRAITKMGPQAADATERLISIACAGDDSLNVRRAAYFAIAKVAPATQAEQFYRDQMVDEALPDLRRLAVKWLPVVIQAKESLVALIQTLSDEDEAVRQEAVSSLVEVGKPSLPHVIAAFDSDNVQTRRYAATTAGRLGILGRDAIPGLAKLLNDPDPQVRESAAAALQVLR